MKNIEFIRKMDSMGRIVIPKDIRKILNIEEEDNLKIIVNDDHVEIRKFYQDNTIRIINIFINNTKELVSLNINSFFPCYEKTPAHILSYIKERKPYFSNSIEQVNIDNNITNGFIGIIPLFKNGELITYVIVQKETSFDEKDILYIELLKTFVESI